MSEPDLKKAKTQEDRVVDSNDCIEFRLVSGTDETGKELKMVENGSFGPIMSHQIFEEEEIAYKQGENAPKIQIYLSPHLLPYMKIVRESESGESIQGTSDLGDGEALEEVMQGAFDHEELGNLLVLDKDAFCETMNKENGLSIKELGEKILERDMDDGHSIVVFHSNLSQASETVKKLHARIEPLLLFFIDAASSIDATDPSWEILLVVQRIPGNDDGLVRLVGMSTIYAFYVFPDKERFRLSQALVLPPYQGKGIGTAIIDATYELAKKRQIVDLTLEDPTEDFRRLRDRKDLGLMLSSDWLVEKGNSILDKACGSTDGTANQRNMLHACDSTIEKMCKDFMMNKKQAQRMWETFIFALAGKSENDQVLALVQGYITGTLENCLVGEAKDTAKNKVVLDTPTGFVMCKQRGAFNTFGTTNVNPVEGVSMERQKLMIAEYVDSRIEEIKQITMQA
eukprot:jgi/Picsp_1/4044/NSC_01555-R1_histone acetyltransferase type b catalytic subunit